MPKHTSTYIPLPMPPTSEKKWAMYLDIEGVIEMFLYDGKQVYTPDFPDIPIVSVPLSDGREITQKALHRLFRKMMQELKVTYNKEHNIWEALSADPF